MKVTPEPGEADRYEFRIRFGATELDCGFRARAGEAHADRHPMQGAGDFSPGDGPHYASGLASFHAASVPAADRIGSVRPDANPDIQKEGAPAQIPDAQGVDRTIPCRLRLEWRDRERALASASLEDVCIRLIGRRLPNGYNSESGCAPSEAEQMSIQRLKRAARHGEADHQRSAVGPGTHTIVEGANELVDV